MDGTASIIIYTQHSSPTITSTVPTRLNISIRHSIRPGPILDVVEIPAHMLALVVRPVATHTLLARLAGRMEGEHVDVAQTHQVDSQDLDAVVQVLAHLLRGVVGVGPGDALVVVRVGAHAQQVQAVQLVEDFNADTVAGFSGCGVGYLHCVVWLLQFGEVGLGDHLVRYWGLLAGGWEASGRRRTVCDVHPRTFNLIGSTDVLARVQRLWE